MTPSYTSTCGRLGKLVDVWLVCCQSGLVLPASVFWSETRPYVPVSLVPISSIVFIYLKCNDVVVGVWQSFENNSLLISLVQCSPRITSWSFWVVFESLFPHRGLFARKSGDSSAFHNHYSCDADIAESIFLYLQPLYMLPSAKYDIVPLLGAWMVSFTAGRCHGFMVVRL